MFNELNTSTRSPSPRMHLISDNATPSSLLSQPSMMTLMMPSSSLPRSPRTTNTATRMSAKAVSLRTCSDAVIYSASQAPTMLANFADAHTPAIREIIDMACDMKPFLMPWKIAGIRQIKIMISNIFINTLKCVYLRIEIFGKYSRLQK